MEIIHCKVCGTPASWLCRTTNEMGVIKELDHFRCPACGLVFVGTALSNEDLGAAYSAYDMTQYYAETGLEHQRKMRSAIRDLNRLRVPKTARVIDIGTGNGLFLKMLAEDGFQVLSGHEIPGAEPAEIAGLSVSLYRDYDYGVLPSCAFDVVTLLDVAEHVPDPVRLFSACCRILKPGGLVYFHTPAVTALDRMMHGLHRTRLARVAMAWQRGRTSIYHLQNYTLRSLEIIFKKVGFSQCSLRRENELSWPVSRYLRIYVCDKAGWPDSAAAWLTPLFYPFVATRVFNANKAVGWARKEGREPGSLPS